MVQLSKQLCSKSQCLLEDPSLLQLLYEIFLPPPFPFESDLDTLLLVIIDPVRPSIITS